MQIIKMNILAILVILNVVDDNVVVDDELVGGGKL